MRETAVGFFRSLTRLRDFANPDDQEAHDWFLALAALAAWASKQRGRPNSEHDRILEGKVRAHTSPMVTLAMHLATVDPHFFDLTKRMIARSLDREPPDIVQRKIASCFLVSEQPKQQKTTLARNVCLVLAVIVGHRLGWYPTEGESRADSPLKANRSSCAKLVIEMQNHGVAITYDTVEGAWKGKQLTLVGAGFDPNEISEVFEDLFRCSVDH